MDGKITPLKDSVTPLGSLLESIVQTISSIFEGINSSTAHLPMPDTNQFSRLNLMELTRDGIKEPKTTIAIKTVKAGKVAHATRRPLNAVLSVESYEGPGLSGGPTAQDYSPAKFLQRQSQISSNLLSDSEINLSLFPKPDDQISCIYIQATP
jgi:hypothetical protein